MASDVALGPLGTSIQTAEVDDGAITKAKLAADAQGEWVKYGEVDATTTPAASFDFSSLPAHKYWKVVFFLRKNTADPVTIGCRINNDSGANQYRTGYTTWSAFGMLNATYILLGVIDTNGAELWDVSGEMRIMDAENTGKTGTLFRIQSSSLGIDAATDPFPEKGKWIDDAVIDQIEVFTVSSDTVYGKVVLYYHDGMD